MTRARETYYAALQLEPEWSFTQLQSAFSGTSWKGWPYAPKSILDWSPMGSLVPFILALILLLAALVWLSRTGGDSPIDRSHGVALIGIGAVLSFAAVAPVIVSNFTLKNAVGPLDGRLLYGAAIGHGLVVVGLVTLISCAAPTRSLQIAAPNTIFAALIAVALVGGVGVQRMYANAWSAQLRIVDALRTQAPSILKGTVLAVLNVPSGPFDIRFYYPFTQLVRRYYNIPTLHALPYQRDFPPDEQTVVFREQKAYGLVELVRQEIGEFPYDQMLAFELNSYDEVTPVSEIGEAYLCDDSCLSIPFLQAEDWAPAPGPVPLNDIKHFRLDQEPPKTAWRRLLDGAAEFNRRFPSP